MFPGVSREKVAKCGKNYPYKGVPMTDMKLVYMMLYYTRTMTVIKFEKSFINNQVNYYRKRQSVFLRTA